MNLDNDIIKYLPYLNFQPGIFEKIRGIQEQLKIMNGRSSLDG